MSRSFLNNNRLPMLPNGGDFNNLAISKAFSLNDNKVAALESGVFSSLSVSQNL